MGMSENELGISCWHSKVLEQRCRRMSYVMDANKSYDMLKAYALEGARKIVWINRSATPCREDKLIAVMGKPFISPGTSPGLPCSLGRQYFGCQSHEGQVALAGSGLHRPLTE
jgi:hypothetical protein